MAVHLSNCETLPGPKAISLLPRGAPLVRVFEIALPKPPLGIARYALLGAIGEILPRAAYRQTLPGHFGGKVEFAGHAPREQAAVLVFA